MKIQTTISCGYADLINTFFKANNLNVAIEGGAHIILSYEDDSDTAYGITFMSVKHLGLENMLCDYLIRCGISPNLIGYGKHTEPRDLKALDKKWEEHRKLIGFR